jgi:hypothetical protein
MVLTQKGHAQRRVVLRQSPHLPSRRGDSSVGVCKTEQVTECSGQQKMEKMMERTAGKCFKSDVDENSSGQHVTGVRHVDERQR